MSTKLYPTFISGNICQFTLPTGTVYTELVFPCSFKKLKLMQNNLQVYVWKKINGVDTKINSAPTFCINNDISFPVVNGKSPCTLNLVRNNAQATQDVTFVIEQIGGVGDEKYWDYGLDRLGGLNNSSVNVRITNQPSSVSAREGETVTLSVTATGAVYGYMWQVLVADTWQNVIDGTNATYETLMVQSLDGKKYRCGVISMYGDIVYSDIATLTLDTTPAPENSSKGDVEEKEIISEPIEKKEKEEVNDEEREVEE